MGCETRERSRSVFNLLFLLFLAGTFLPGEYAAGASPKLEPGKPVRGIALLSSSIGPDIQADEIETFCRECKIGLVVVDFAWITHHFARTNFDAVESLLKKLRGAGVVVGAMYRPRALLEKDAQVHFALQADGSLPKSHLHLCFAHADSVDWGASWGEKILKALPSVDHMILYNVASLCHCEACLDGAGFKHAEAFVKTCGDRWRKIRPAVKLGHVGGRLEYGEQLDFFCPFFSVLRRNESTPVNTDAAARQIKGLAARAKKKPVVPLAKICWSSETKNDTQDVVNSLASCEKQGLGCLLWYYGWVFHSDAKRYDPKAIVEALGGNWGALEGFFQDDGGKKPPPGKALNPSAYIFFHSKESREGQGPRLVIRGSRGGPVELAAVKDAILISYMPDHAGGLHPKLAVQLSDANRAILAFPSPVNWSGGALKKAELVLDLGLPKLAVEKPFEIALHVVKEKWEENDVRWRNQPPFAEKPALVVEVKPEKGIVRFDVTGIVAGWFVRRVPNFGLLMKVHKPVKNAPPAAAPPPAKGKELIKRLGTTLPWETDAKEALRKGAEKKRLVLTFVGVEHEEKAEHLMQAFVFTDPAVVELVERRFVPLHLRYTAMQYAHAKTTGKKIPDDPLALLGTSVAELKAPALCVSTPGGKAVAKMESIGSFDPLLVYRFLQEALGKAGPFSRVEAKGGEDLLAAGDLKAAEKFFKKANASEREWGLARIASRRRRHEEALSLARALKRKGGRAGADARVLEGMCLLRLGRYDDAVRALDGALRVKTKPGLLSMALHFHGALAFRRKYPDAAKTSWKRLQEEYPDSLWALRASACLTWPEWIGYETLRALPEMPGPITGTERPVPPAKEQALIERALAYLLEAQEKDGSWPHLDAPYWRAPVTALGAHALLAWSKDLKDPLAKDVEHGLGQARSWILDFQAGANTETADSFGAAYMLEFLIADHARKGSGAKKKAVEKAVAFLFAGQCPGGAWSYNRHFGVSWKGGFSSWPRTDKGRVHSMNTGLALLVLADAKGAGFAVDAKALERGVNTMKAMRCGPGAYTYTYPVPRIFEKAELNLGRGPLCEQALFALGASDASGLRKAVDTFMRLREGLRISVKLTKGWIPPRAAGNYFFFFAYYHAARAVRALGEDAARKLLPLLRADLLAVVELDASWVDSHGAGKPYGTAMALLVLKMAREARGE